MKSQVTILLLITVIASGCAANGGTSTTQTSGTSPITINSFDATPNPATSDRRVNINLQLENTGDADAERVAARLFGPTWAQSSTDIQAWRDSNGGEVTQEERTLYYDTLRAAGESTPSVPKQQSLTLTAPALSQGRQIDYNFQTQIFYQYETTANTDFTLVSGERFREQNMQRTQATLESSSGPIELEIRGTTPKIFYKDDNEQGINSEICIKATNTGTGTPFLGGEVDSDRIYSTNEDDDYTQNTILLSIDNISNVDFEAKTGDGQNTVRLNLVNGEQGFQCYNMNADELGGQEEQNINTQITAQYNYMKEDTTTVTVEGRRGTNDPELQDPGNNDNDDSNDEDSEESSNDETEWVFSQEPTENDIDALETGWDIDDASDPSETCAVLAESDDESAQNLLDELCSEE